MSEADEFAPGGAHDETSNPLMFIPATQENKDTLSKAAFGITRDEAHKQNICVECRQDVDKEGRIYSPAGAREYRISGVCEKCFDSMFGDDE